MSIEDIKELVRWRDKADELASTLEQYSLELQQMRAEAATKTIERDEARRERDEAQRDVKAAYQRGAEAMRVACAKACLDTPPYTHRTDCVTVMLDLPIPEET